MTKKTTYVICLILWSICLGIAVVGAISGITFHAVTSIFPLVVCVMHYIGELRRELSRKD